MKILLAIVAIMSLTGCLSMLGHRYTFADEPEETVYRKKLSPQLNMLLASKQLAMDDYGRFRRGMYQINPYTMGDAVTDGLKLADAALLFKEGFGLLGAVNLANERPLGLRSRMHSNGFYIKRNGMSPEEVENRIYQFMEAYVDHFDMEGYERHAIDLKRNKHATERYLGMTRPSRQRGEKDAVSADYQRTFIYNSEAYAGVNFFGFHHSNSPEVIDFITEYTKSHHDITFFVRYDIDHKTGQCNKTGFMIEKGEQNLIPELICQDITQPAKVSG